MTVFQFIRTENRKNWMKIQNVLIFFCLIAICLVSIQPYVMQGVSTTFLLDIVIHSSDIQNLMLILIAFPFVSSFYEDYQHNYLYSIVIRSGVSNYSYGKVWAIFGSTFFFSFIVLLIFTLLLLLRYPLFSSFIPLDDQLYPTYFEFAFGRFPMTYIIAYQLVYSLSVSFWCVVGLYTSAYIPNKYVAIMSPYILKYTIGYISLYFPPPLREFNIATSSPNVLGLSNHTGLINLGYFISFYLIMTAIVGRLFHKKVERRLRHEDR